MSKDTASHALVALGWDAHFERVFASFPRALSPARIVTQHRSEYVAAGATGALAATLSGRLRNLGQIPVVGDWVALALPEGAGRASIRQLVPRRTAFVRKAPGRETAPQVIAANIDVVCIVASLDAPLTPRRLERYLAVAWDSGATPVILLSKADACPAVATAVAQVQSLAPGVDVIPISARTGQGLDQLGRHLVATRTVALLGPSGVGKSTLANALLHEDRFVTGDVDADGRGRHTTTRRELVQLPTGALLIDTPGMRELGLWSDGDGVTSAFEEIDALSSACRFADCRHDTEPGCAVRSAIDAGQLDPERLAHWRDLERESAYEATRLDAQMQADSRSHAKMLTRALRARLRRKYE
jgi:ribosome biogenesis GTPase / thiamine phosphate phosphatase